MLHESTIGLYTEIYHQISILDIKSIITHTFHRMSIQALSMQDLTKCIKFFVTLHRKTPCVINVCMCMHMCVYM